MALRGRQHQGLLPHLDLRRVALAAALVCVALLSTAVARGQDGSTARSEAPAVGTPVAAPPSDAPAGKISPPASLVDLPAWLDYKARSHLGALPMEARLFYRRGLMAAQAGSREDALRFVRGAAELDPSFVAPHLTLASWSLVREPSQALLQIATMLELSRQNFALQLALAGNALYLMLQALFLALIAAGMIVIGLRQQELRHGWCERLSQFLSPVTARLWSWAFLILPFVAGFGLALPTVAFLGLLWPSLRVRERALFVGLALLLVSAPWTTAQLERLTLPFRQDEAPVYGVALVENEAWSAARAAELSQQAAAHPDDPFAQFASGWVARRGGDFVSAEHAYRRALAGWPGDGPTINNLGNTLAMQGRFDEALANYLGAVDHNPADAAAWYNASQIYTRRFDYHSATDALTRASSLDFELVKNYQSRATSDGVLSLADEWIAPRRFWSSLSGPSTALGRQLPPAWRSSIECSGWTFSAVAGVLAVLAVALGLAHQRRIPLRACSNCGAVVCRRCAQRRRETALCPDCATVEARAESPEFARVLLFQQQKKQRSRTHLARTAFATLVPGLGILSFRRVALPLALLMAVVLLASGPLHLGAPFTYEPRVALPDQQLPMWVTVGLWVAIELVSLMGYFVLVARAGALEAQRDAPIRGRARPSARHTSAAAA